MKPLAAAEPFNRGVKHYIARFVMWAAGWTAEGALPQGRQCVVIAAPHTTNWDGFWLVVLSWWWGFDLSWLLKHTWFKGPLGSFLRWVNAMPVDRRAPQGLVEQLAERFKADRHFVLAVPPEGTRKKKAAWKSGFYHIARHAGVPICCGFLDYARRCGGFGPSLVPTGDLGADMDTIRRFYVDIPGKNPELFTFPVLPDEGITEEQARERIQAT